MQQNSTTSKGVLVNRAFCMLLALALGAGLVPIAPFAEPGEAYADTKIRWTIALGTWRSSGDTRVEAWANLVEGIGRQNKRSDLGVEETWSKYSDGTPEEGALVSYIDSEGNLVSKYIYYYCNMPPDLTASNVTGYVGDLKSLEASVNSGGKLSYEVEDESIAEVDSQGRVHFKKAGTTTVTVRAASTNLYIAASTTVTVSASRRASTTYFSYESMAKTYGDASFTVSPRTTSDSVMSFSSSDPAVASIDGRGTVTVNSVGTTTIRAYMYPSTYFEESSGTFELTVEPLPVDKCSIQVGSVTWNKDASEREPSVKVSYAGKTIDPSNYSISFSDDNSAGWGTATVTGKANLNGQASKSYTIGQKDATGANIDLGGSVFEYTGAEVRPTPSIVDDGVLLAPNCYDVTYSDNVKAGEASVRIDFKGNYSGSVTRTFVIGSKMESQLVTGLGDGEFVYTGEPIVPQLKVEGADESCYDLVFCDDTVNVGEKTVRVVGKAGYYGQATLTYRVVPRPIDEVRVGEVTYTGAAASPDVAVYVDGSPVDAGCYDVLVNSGVNVGDECFVHVAGKGNYTGAIDQAYSISPRKIESVSVRSEPKAYDGEPAEIALLVLSTLGEVAQDDYTVSYARGGEPTDDLASAGRITATVTGAGNFTGTATVEYEIARASIEKAMLEIEGAGAGFTYTGDELRPAVTVSLAGNELGAQDYSVSYADNVEAGMATVTVTGLGNYSGSASRQFEIAPTAAPEPDPDPEDSPANGGGGSGSSDSGGAANGGGSKEDGSNASTGAGTGADAGESTPGASSGDGSTGANGDSRSSEQETPSGDPAFEPGSSDSSPGEDSSGASGDDGSGDSASGSASGDSASDASAGDGLPGSADSDGQSGDDGQPVETQDGGLDGSSGYISDGQPASSGSQGASARTVKDTIAAISDEGGSTTAAQAKARLTSATLAETRAVYDGTEKMPRVALVSAGDKSVPEGSYYTLPMRDGAITSDFVSAGTVRVWVVGTGDFEGSVYADYIISKATPKVSFKSRTKNLSAEKVMKAKKSKRRLVLRASTNGDAKVSYKVVKSNKRVFLRGNKAILRKKTKAGLYSVIVEASAPESANWNAASKRRIVTFVVK